MMHLLKAGDLIATEKLPRHDSASAGGPCPPRKGTPIPEVLDVQPRDRHLLLMVQFTCERDVLAKSIQLSAAQWYLSDVGGTMG
jgi:hypothetical protein